MKDLSEDTALKMTREMLAKKDILACLMCEQLSEFKDMNPDDVIKECLQGELQVGSVPVELEDKTETLDIYLTADMPQKTGTVILGVCIKISPKENVDIVPCELDLALHLYYQEKNKILNEPLHCYIFYFYVDPLKEMQNKIIHMKVRLHDMKHGDLLKEDRCEAIAVYMGDDRDESKRLH